MDRDELKRIAKIAGLIKGQHWDRSNLDTEHLMMFYELAVQHERESCAKLIVNMPYEDWAFMDQVQLADAIRAKA